MLSPYCKAYPLRDKPGQTLLFSTRKASLTILPTDAVERLRAGEVPGEAAARTLEQLGVLCGDLEAERGAVFGFLGEANRVDDGVVLAVILGMACNFACPYCYEGTLKGAAAMEDATAHGVAAFAASRLAPGKKRLVIDFYGGEPLLYIDRIRRLAAALGASAAEKGATFSFTLVTNGSLLTPALVREFVPLGLSAVRVTLDGPAETHDRSRPFRSGAGSFDVILRNVRECCGLVPVGVGGNYTRENWREFPRLLDRLESEGLGPDRLAHVRFEPVVQVRDRFAHPEFSGGCCSGNEAWTIEASLALREAVLRRGYRTSRIQPVACMVDLEESFTVDWDGTLYKCLGLIGRPEFAAGDVWSGPTDHGEAYGGERWRANQECRACEYLPLCFGGCRFARYQSQGSPSGVECRRAFLDAALEDLVLQDARYRRPKP